MINAYEYAIKFILIQHGYLITYHSETFNEVIKKIPPLKKMCATIEDCK